MFGDEPKSRSWSSPLGCAWNAHIGLPGVSGPAVGVNGIGEEKMSVFTASAGSGSAPPRSTGKPGASLPFDAHPRFRTVIAAGAFGGAPAPLAGYACR